MEPSPKLQRYPRGSFPDELSEKLTVNGALPNWLLAKKSATGGFVTTMYPEPGTFVGAAVPYQGISTQDRIAKSASQRTGCTIIPSHDVIRAGKHGSRLSCTLFSLLFFLKKVLWIQTKNG